MGKWTPGKWKPRTWGVLLALPACLSGQSLPPNAALVRGVLVERDPQTTAGQFSVRRDDNLVFRYRFDARTYVERDHELIDVSRMVPGEKVEVLSDEGPGTSLRYARTIHVLQVPAPAAARPLSPYRTQGATRSFRSPLDRLGPVGTLSFSGVIFHLSDSRMVIHTREAGDQTILLRQDTRYLAEGDTVDAGELKPNMRVFVRAGRNLYNDIEAYQVIWGHILRAPK
jgi:hypothetical protein